jgi:hypothetical protein
LGRLDVFANGRWEESGIEAPWRLVIEAKIDAVEGEKQLSLYDEWLGLDESEEALRVFLTPDGIKPKSSSARWHALSFLELAGAFRRAYSDLQGRAGYHFLRFYLAGVLRDVCRLQVGISSDCENPYAAVDYLRAAMDTLEPEDGDGRSR